MKVNTQAVNFNANPQLLEFIQKRMDKLDLFYDKVIQTDVFLKVENTSDKENKIVDIKLNIPVNDCVVKKQCKTFEEGIMLATNSLKRQLAKKKDKLRAK